MAMLSPGAVVSLASRLRLQPMMDEVVGDAVLPPFAHLPAQAEELEAAVVRAGVAAAAVGVDNCTLVERMRRGWVRRTRKRRSKGKGRGQDAC